MPYNIVKISQQYCKASCPKAGHSRSRRATPFGTHRANTLRQCKNPMRIGADGGKVWNSNVIRFSYSHKSEIQFCKERSMLSPKRIRGGEGKRVGVSLEKSGQRPVFKAGNRRKRSSLGGRAARR
ncbi:hypothetical protein AVEN_141114-1 [Araneus ventricosus]|uniref:Uncharacterized protein n=1 Tax=Araneus ventricosus TaxID=182803 RepID=A0A4Y2PV36_ARAVE|nr:hypothetical protein AVEN_141114-1 [Araneus ventricosus]